MSVPDGLFILGMLAVIVGAGLIAPAGAIIAGGVMLMLSAGLWERARRAGDTP